MHRRTKLSFRFSQLLCLLTSTPVGSAQMLACMYGTVPDVVRSHANVRQSDMELARAVAADR